MATPESTASPHQDFVLSTSLEARDVEQLPSRWIYTVMDDDRHEDVVELIYELRPKWVDLVREIDEIWDMTDYYLRTSTHHIAYTSMEMIHFEASQGPMFWQPQPFARPRREVYHCYVFLCRIAGLRFYPDGLWRKLTCYRCLLRRRVLAIPPDQFDPPRRYHSFTTCMLCTRLPFNLYGKGHDAVEMSNAEMALTSGRSRNLFNLNLNFAIRPVAECYRDVRGVVTSATSLPGNAG